MEERVSQRVWDKALEETVGPSMRDSPGAWYREAAQGRMTRGSPEKGNWDQVDARCQQDE